MPEHSVVTTGRPEPVAIAAVAQAVLALLVTLGWVNLDDTKIAAIGTVVALVAATSITLFTRARVTPVSDPTSATGEPLVPVSEVTSSARVPVAELLARERPT